MDPVTDAPVVLENPLGLDGLEFVEFASPDSAELERVFTQFGFQKIGQHKRRRVMLYRQNQINFVINDEPGTFAAKFARQHGPSLCAIGFRARSAQRAFDSAVQRGARPIGAKTDSAGHSFPAIFGIGDSAIYFVDRYRAPVHFDDDFRYLQPELVPKGRGLVSIDQLTANVPRGELQKWAGFYARVMGFREVRHLDIKGERTGLTAKTMRSPCGRITIPINEPTEGTSQIQEYLDAYRGSGFQHLTLNTADVAGAVRGLANAGVTFQDAPPPEYYDAAAARISRAGASLSDWRERGLLIDGDDDGLVLERFTRGVVGPLFFGLVQRSNQRDPSGANARALFEVIERDQLRRGHA